MVNKSGFEEYRRQSRISCSIAVIMRQKNKKMSNSKDIKKIQNEILRIFKEYKKVCEKHNLRYFAIGGTCIGAVRHKGFIPWDDDLDVAMPYEDYKEFIDVASTEICSGLELYKPEDHKPYIYNFIKLHNVNTTLIEQNCTRFPDRYTGIYIDIMPIYGLPKGAKLQKQYQNKCDSCLRANRTIRLPFSYGNSFLSKMFWIEHLPITITKPYSYYTDKLERIFADFEFDESDKILFGWRRKPSWRYPNITYKNMFNYRDFASAVQMQFEDTVINVPVGYDAYLKADFGNYMELPPIEKRTPQHPVDLLDFEKPFRVYQNAYKEGKVTWL